MTISSQNPRRIAVIGATGRVGTEVARTFARLGWSLELTARRMDGLDALITEFESFATTASIQGHRLDFLDGSTIAEFTQVVGTQPLDAVVVAGSPFEEMRLEEATIERFTRQAAAQVGGPATLVAGLRPALERSLAPGGPAVIFFGDVHALHRPRAGATPYLAAKAAAEGLVGLLAVELAPIRVMGISPGVVGWPDDWPEDRRASYLKRVPLGRAGTAGEAAALARSLIIDATYCTGVVIPIDGGRHLR
jgi:pteridine reductase